jgi:hypothetical protein
LKCLGSSDCIKTSGSHLKGVSVQAMTPQMRESLDIPKRITGVVIADIEDGSPADGILMKNDVIVEINRNRITNMNEYEKVEIRLTRICSFLYSERVDPL